MARTQTQRVGKGKNNLLTDGVSSPKTIAFFPFMEYTEYVKSKLGERQAESKIILRPF